MSAPRPGALRILVVEDERELGRVLDDYLRELGYEAEVVASAEEALERLRAAPPHVIVLDVKLPGMSGLDFLGLPVVRNSGVPIIVISGYVTEDQARECLRRGALEFLAKPVPLEILTVALEHVAAITGPPAEIPASAHERRRASRLPVTLPLRVRAEGGVVATGAVIEASATGLRARMDRGLPVGMPARLTVSLPDGGPPLDVLALVARTDAERLVAFWFLDMTPGGADRLLARAHAAR